MELVLSVNDPSDENHHTNLISLVFQLVFGNNTGLVINMQAGDGSVTTSISYLEKLSKDSQYQFRLTRLDLYFENSNTYEDVLIQKAAPGGVIVVDGAEHLNRFPKLAAFLNVQESPCTKVIYIVCVRAN